MIARATLAILRLVMLRCYFSVHGGNLVLCSVQLASPVFHIGFLPTVYKILQCVCVNCSKLLADKSSAEFIRASKIVNRKKRLMAMLKLCRARKSCKGTEGSAAVTDEDGNLVNPPGMAADIGCSVVQPSFRREGLKITVEFPDTAVETQNVADKKQVCVWIGRCWVAANKTIGNFADYDC
jgi:DNA-directed RNA polymerase beta' subunit